MVTLDLDSTPRGQQGQGKRMGYHVGTRAWSVLLRWQPVIDQCGHKDTISLVHRSAHEPSLELTDRSPAPGGLEWLVGAAVSLSLRAVSCLSYVPEGSWAACHTYRRAPELLGISTIVVLSCLLQLSASHWGLGVHLLTYHRYFECTCMRTGGLLSAPAKVPLWYY